MRAWKSLAGIVAYNPDSTRLLENIAAVYSQVVEVLVIDNNSASKDYIEVVKSQFPNIIFIQNAVNYGIAKALNQILYYAKNNGYKWVLSLDQDSVVKNDLVSKYDRFLLENNKDENIAMVTSLRNDRNYDLSESYQNSFEYVDRCITSASYACVDIVFNCGLYDEAMFIDYVDFDLCAKLIENNYYIVRLNEIGFLHELGKSRRMKFLNKSPIVYNESAFRKYYYSRNVIYYINKHSSIVNKRQEIKILLKTFVLTIFFEDDKWNKCLSMIKGIRDSRAMIKRH